MQRKNSASPRPLRFMTSDREPLLLEPQHALMKALPSNARLKLMSNPQNAFQSNYPIASPRKMANLQGSSTLDPGVYIFSCSQCAASPLGLPPFRAASFRTRPTIRYSGSRRQMEYSQSSG